MQPATLGIRVINPATTTKNGPVLSCARRGAGSSAGAERRRYLSGDSVYGGCCGGNDLVTPAILGKLLKTHVATRQVQPETF